MADTSVRISFEIVGKAAEKALSDVASKAAIADKALGSLQDKGKSTFDEITLHIGKSLSVLDIFKGNLAANIATRAFDAVLGVFQSIGELLHKMVDEAAKSEDAINGLNSALKLAGLFSKDSSKELQEFAEHIQNVTIYSDDAVLASERLLASLTNLNVDGIKKATQASVDLAATLKVDLNTATELVAKAVNGNVTALVKQNIIVEKGRTTAQGLANVLKALSTKQGAATEAAKTYTGAQEQLKNAEDDLLKTLGKLFIQNANVVEGVTRFTEVFKEATGWVNKNKEFLIDLGTTIVVTTGIIAAATAGWVIYSAIAGSTVVANAALAISMGGLSGALALMSTAAEIAWVAVTGPVGITIVAITAVGAAVYQVVKNWTAVKELTELAIASALEYAAVAVGIFSKTGAAALKAEAQAWREKTIATKEATEAIKADAVETEEQRKVREANLAREAEKNARYDAEQLARRKEFNASVSAEELNHTLTLQEIESAHKAKLQEIRGQFDARALADRQEETTQELKNRQLLERDELQIVIDSEAAKAKAVENTEERKKAILEASEKARLAKIKLQDKQEFALADKKVKDEEDKDRVRIQNRTDTLNTIATLQNSNNKALAIAGKAAGITQIAIDTPVAIAKSLAAFPVPFNFIAAGLVAAAMAEQAARIAGVNFADGGIVPGTSYSGDKVAANVNSGEMILNRQQQTNLFSIANGGGSEDSSNVISIARAIGQEMASQPINIQIDGREIIQVTRAQLASGRTFA